MKGKQGYHDFLPGALATMERPPARHLRTVTWIIIIFVVIAVLWLTFSTVDIIVSAQGKIVPVGQVKVIQPAGEGIVRNVYVHNGQRVNIGDPLVELDSTSSFADKQQLNMRMNKARLTVQRLRAESGEEIILGDGLLKLNADLLNSENRFLQASNNAFTETVIILEHERDQARARLSSARHEREKTTAEIKHLESQLSKKEKQAEAGLIPGQEVIDSRFVLQSTRKKLKIVDDSINEVELKLVESEKRLAAASIDHRRQIYKELAEAEQQLLMANQALGRAREYQVLKSPVNGIVQQLSVHTIGAVVNRAQILMAVIPVDTELEIDAKLLNKDIGFVAEDIPAKIKVDAFEFTRYGTLAGTLQWVGADAIIDEDLGLVYPARISLEQRTLPNVVNGKVASVLPGMSVSTDIVIGQRRLIEYFIGPLLRYRDESLTER
ncbi:MAG: HlyD family type I secretion periplasmic adaptor subunit [Arenicellales bacterium]